MLSLLNTQHHRSEDSGPSGPCALWTVDLKLSHLDWNPEATLIHFQGQYLTIYELDYIILQQEIQNTPKTKAEVDIGEFCLVEDASAAYWYRGRVQRHKDGVSDVFLIDHGSVLSVDVAHISLCSNDLFILPPKIVCGFLANVLVLGGSCNSSSVVDFLSSLIGKNIKGYIQALLPHRVLLLDAPDINNELVRHGFANHMDKDTFLLLVELLTEAPLKQNIDPVPDLLVDKQSGREYRYKSSGLKVYEQILPFCGPRMSCGTRAKVRVTAAVHSGLFYCQMASKESDLLVMSKKLGAGECRRKSHQHNTQDNVGLLCSVKGKSGKWYRGFVQFIPVNSQVRVLFVDFGFPESVKLEDVHSLPPDLYSTPIMAFPCSLSSLKAQDEQLMSQQLSFLKAGLLGGVLDVQIDSFDEEHHLYLITVVAALDKYTTEEVSRQPPPQIKDELCSTAEDVAPQGGPLCFETIIGRELVKTLKEEELQSNSVFEGYLEHARNPNNFWIRTQKRNYEFQEMMNKMSDHFANVKLEDDILLNPEPGALCCAMYEEDMHFYRGVVTKKLEHGSEVLFIDFGNIQKVPCALIKKIPETFASISAFGLCCTLVNVMPLDDVWTCSNSDFFRAMLSNKELLVHIVQITQHKCIIDLYEVGCDHGWSISELMVSAKQADYWNNIPVKPVELNQKDKRTDTGIQESHINGNEAWDKSEKQSSVPTSFKTLDIQPNCEFTVQCSCIYSLSDFWCQLQDKVPDLEDMMCKIQQYYTLHTVTLKHEELCCVARSPQDGKWYRASIQEREKKHIKVLLVDYGVSVQVKDKQLQRIMPEYFKLEGQAFQCCLLNQIELVGNSQEMCNHLRKFIADSCGYLRCKVVSQLNDKNELLNIVELYNTQTQQSFTNQLMEQSLVKLDFPKEFVYSSFDLMPNHEEEVYITHVSGEWDIYCQLCRNTEAIQNLEVKISEEMKKIKRANAEDAPVKPCLAKYLDGNWYRALVQTTPSLMHFSVFFVDYGNTGISEKTHVVSIPRDSYHLLSTPIQALKFNLASVSRKDLYIEVKEWLDKAVLNKQMKAIILGTRQDGSFDVQLFDGDLNLNEKAKELIGRVMPKPKSTVKFTYVTKNDKRSTSSRSKNLAKGKSYSSKANEHRCSHVRARPHSKKEHVKYFVDVTAMNQFRQPRLPKNARTTNSKTHPLKHFEEPHVSRVNLQIEKKKGPQACENPPLSCLPARKEKEGCSLMCFASHIDSVGSFFLQLLDDEVAILKMVEEINSTAEHSLRSAFYVRFNDLVLVRYDENATLYRAVIRAYEDGSRYKVNFLDYGNSAVVEKEKLYMLSQEFLSQPAFSIHCCLVDSSLYDDDSAFTNAVMGKSLTVHFVRKHETIWEVEIEILDSEETLGEQMLKPQEGMEGPACSSETAEKAKICDQTALNVTENEQGTTDTNVKDTKLTKASFETFRNKSKRPVKIRPKWKGILKKTSQSVIKKRDCANAPFAFLTQLLQQNQQLPYETQNQEPLPDTSPHQHLAFAPISLDKEYFGVAASVKTPSEFCVVLKDSLPVVNQVAILLEDLSGYKLALLPKYSLMPGASCLLRSDLNKWCRAEILHVDSSTVVLNLVDYGLCQHFSSQDRIDLGKIPEDLLKLPKTAYPCVLRGVRPAGEDGNWSEEATIYVQELLNCNLKVVFREVLSNTRWTADVLVDGVHVANKLVDAGHARYTDAILGLRFQEQSLRRLIADMEVEPRLEPKVANEDSTESSDKAAKLGTKQCVLI
ncbi:tudor domain-containing protein 15 isoform X2 [Phyllopteryx taeniolatus]|uniref:tudor domain-containing protein 15 isoform X2 n=1 Tax=Phyllopteryx taeniolatus TaxID=161469 RepID=UPI002AD56212|nr:tudor domain-containing protein 15 isoform X2 [Phyllopteryx taeniolatus]